MKNIPETIRLIRATKAKEQGVSHYPLTLLAKDIGVHRPTIYRWLAGEEVSYGSEIILVSLCRQLGIDTE